MATGIWFDNAHTGPASYATGGFTVVTGLSTVENALVDVVTAGANLGQVEFDLSYSGGNITVKVMRRNYDKLTSLGDLTNLPSGVSSRATSGGTYDTVSHLHAIDHDHAITPNSTAPANPTATVLTIALNEAILNHNHTLNLPNHVQDSGAETAHVHTWNSIYQHQHTITNTSTDAAMTELTNGTDLSGTTLLIHAVGTE